LSKTPPLLRGVSESEIWGFRGPGRGGGGGGGGGRGGGGGGGGGEWANLEPMGPIGPLEVEVGVRNFGNY